MGFVVNSDNYENEILVISGDEYMYKMLTAAIICLILSGCAVWNKQHENKLYSFDVNHFDNTKNATKFKFSQFLQSELDAFFFGKDSLGTNGYRKLRLTALNKSMELDVNYDYVLMKLGKNNAPDYKTEDTSNIYTVYTIINTDKMSNEWQGYKIHDRLILKFNRNTRQLYDLEIDKQKPQKKPVYTSTYPDDCSSSAKPTKMSDIIKAFSYYWLVDSLANNSINAHWRPSGRLCCI